MFLKASCLLRNLTKGCLINNHTALPSLCKWKPSSVSQGLSFSIPRQSHDLTQHTVWAASAQSPLMGVSLERTAFCHFQPRVNVLPHPWCPWNAAGLYGALLETNPFCIPHFLFVENRLHSVTLHSLSSKGQIQTNSFLAYRGREGMQKQRRSSEENNRITVGQGPDSSSRNIYIHIYIYMYMYTYINIYLWVLL